MLSLFHEVNKTLIATIPSFLLPSHLLLSPPLSPLSPLLSSPLPLPPFPPLSPLSPLPPSYHLCLLYFPHSTLYWTALSSAGRGRSIQYMSLNSPSIVHTLSVSGKTNDLMIDKLTFEPSTKSLYWINRSNSTIERFDILSGNLTIIAADAASVSGMYLYLFPLLHHCDYSTSLLPLHYIISTLYHHYITSSLHNH